MRAWIGLAASAPWIAGRTRALAASILPARDAGRPSPIASSQAAVPSTPTGAGAHDRPAGGLELADDGGVERMDRRRPTTQSSAA